jgi:ActR/RegA family two-component response regulator
MNQRGKVLVVEDNPKWANRLKEVLEENNFHVSVTKTKAEALKILENENFHFATIDLQLDESTLDDKKFEGWEVMKKVFDVGADRMMSIMVLTGFPGDEEVDNRMKALRNYKATFFMEKSKWDKKEFIDTVIKAVEYRNVHFKDDYKS